MRPQYITHAAYRIQTHSPIFCQPKINASSSRGVLFAAGARRCRSPLSIRYPVMYGRAVAAAAGSAADVTAVRSLPPGQGRAVYMSRKIRKFRTDNFDTCNKRKFCLMQLM